MQKDRGQGMKDICHKCGAVKGCSRCHGTGCSNHLIKCNKDMCKDVRCEDYEICGSCYKGWQPPPLNKNWDTEPPKVQKGTDPKILCPECEEAVVKVLTQKDIAADEGIRFCILCGHFYFCSGHEGWSEVTPGENAEMYCQKGKWALDLQAHTQDDMREAMKTANRCEHYIHHKEMK